MGKIQSTGGLNGKAKEWIKEYLDGRKMQTIVRDEKSQWRRVSIGAPQGLVLAPIMFLTYVKDIPQGINSYISLFADDAKLQRRIQKEEDCKVLQKVLNTLYEWSRTWDMEFNAKKCHVLRMGKSGKRPEWTYNMGDEIIKGSVRLGDRKIGDAISLLIMHGLL